MSPVPGVRQVAALAGVSRGTVSNVLNHPHRVDAETLKRVHEAIETLGYVPNTLARALSTGTNTMAGLILPGLHTSIFVNMARNAQVAAHRIGLNLLIADSEAVPARQIEHLRYFEASRARGILIVPSDESRETVEAINRAAERGVPVVAINFVADALSVPSVVTDEVQAGRMAVEIALARPARRIVWVEGEVGYQPVIRRRRGVFEAMAERAGGPQFESIDAGGLNVSHGTRIAPTILDRLGTDQPAAIITASTPLAVGILRHCLAQGLRVPEQIEIIACEEDTEVLVPGEHVVAVGADGRDLGDRAIEMLGSMTSGAEKSRKPGSITVAPRIVRPADRVTPAINS